MEFASIQEIIIYKYKKYDYLFYEIISSQFDCNICGCVRKWSMNVLWKKGK